MAKKVARRKQVIPENESKAARFIRVCKPRVSKACTAIKLIGFCSTTSYEYTPKQLEQITNALDLAQNEMLAKFAGKKEDAGVFEFKG